jgi:hypothetical protein
MKHILSLLVVAALLSSCGEPPPEPEVTPSSDLPRGQEPAVSGDTAAAPRDLTDRSREAAAAVQGLAEQGQAKAGELLAQAKGLIEAKKLQDVRGPLDQLSEMTLGAEQRETLARLQEGLSHAAKEVQAGLTELGRMVAEKDYGAAASMVSKLTEYQLSPEQQKLFDDLKVQVTELLGTQEGAGKALNNLLGR